MKKLAVSILVLLMLLPAVLAVNLEIEKVSSNEVMISEVKNPAVFDLKIKNLGASDDFQFYNLLGFSMAPKGTVHINNGEIKEVKLMIYPRENFDYRGFYTFEYFIRGNDGDEAKEKITINVIDLDGVFEVGSGEFSPEENSINVYIQNKVNFNFEKIDGKFKSAFFDFEESFSLNPYERKDFSVNLDKEDFKKLTAAFYTMQAEVTAEGKTTNVEGVIKYAESENLITTSRDYGFIINTQVIEKKNEGNVVASSESSIKKNIISRLFTSFSPEPDVVERRGFNVYYTWKKNVSPGESLEIIVRTNWLFPLLIIFFIVAIVVLARQYTNTNLVLRKKVSFVHAKGGEFALKVTILVHAKKNVDRVNVIDRLPPLVKVYERFGGEKPTRVSESNRRIEWNIERLDEGEKRILSYVIYSKVGIMGKFALPEATAVYERDGEIKESSSNKAYFVAEQRKKDLED